MEFGFYAELPDTIEGLVHIRTLPEGEYDYSEPVSLTEKFSGISYSIGMEVNVICSAVNVSDGTIDFVLDNDEEAYDKNYRSSCRLRDHRRYSLRLFTQACRIRLSVNFIFHCLNSGGDETA